MSPSTPKHETSAWPRRPLGLGGFRGLRGYCLGVLGFWASRFQRLSIRGFGGLPP